MHLYVKSAIKSSVVTAGVSCDLRGAGWNKDVVFSKENVIEVLEHSDDGSLSSVYEHSVFGTIRDMKSLSIPSYNNNNNNNNNTKDKKDILVFVSDSGYLSFVGWSAEMDRLICISQVRISSYGFTPKYLGQSVSVSPCQRMIIVTAMQDVIGIFLVLPNISKNSDLLVSSPLSFCERACIIWNLEFIYSGEDPDIILFAIICREDGSNNNKVKLYEFNLRKREVKILYTAEFVSLPLFIIPIPHYPSHFFVVHENMNISLMNSLSNSILCTKSIAEINNSSNDTELLHKWCWLDKMLFLGSDKGTIIQVCIEPPEMENDSMQDDYTFDFVKVGQKTPVSAMIPLAQHMIAMPGEMGDGGIVFVRETTNSVGNHPVVSLEPRSDLYNWAPIIDFQVADYDEENQDQIFAVSGTGSQGSLRIIRNGLAVEVLKTTSKDYNVSGMWLVNTYVVMAFAESTGVYKVSGMSRDFNDFSIGSGLDLNVSTFFAANIFNNLILQVTNGSIRLCTPSSTPDIHGTSVSHNLDPNSVVSCACARNDIIIVGISKPNRLLVFKVLPSVNGTYEIKLVHNVEQEKECSYIEMPVPETCARNFPDALNHIVFVGTHRPSLDIYKIGSSPNESFTKIMSVNLGEREIPASICCNNLGTQSLYLLVGTREGAVLRWDLSLRGSECTLHNLSTRRVGILPVNLVGEQDFGVLALSNHPWLVSSSRNRPTFTSISFPMVSHATRLISPTPGEQSFLFISDQSMNVITFPRNRKLNVSKFDLHATPQRILYINSLKTLVIATRDVKKEDAMVDESDENESEIRVINPIDGKSLFSEPVGPGRVLCLKELKINGQIFILVGTGYELFNNLYTKGVLFLFSVHKDSRKLTRVWQKNLNGYVQSAVQHLDFLIVGVSDSIVLFQLGQDLSITKLHVAKTRYPITSLSLGAARMLVGSMRDGLMFYHFDQEQRSLQFKLGDARSRITSDCLLINDETAFGIDRLGNLHVLVYGSETEHHYGYSAIEAECSFSLRETALKIHTTSSLVYQAEIAHPKPLIILCPTMLGSVIAVTQLQDKTIYNQLAALSEKMAVHSITAPLLGNSHSRYRSELQSSKNVIDGDLIGQFVDLSPQVQESICAEVEWKGPPLSPHQICRIIEKIDQTLF